MSTPPPRGRPPRPARLPGGRELSPWLLVSVAVAIVAAGLGLVFYAALIVPAAAADAPRGLGRDARIEAFALACAVPVAALVAAHCAHAAARGRAPLWRAFAALAVACAGLAGWAATYFG